MSERYEPSIFGSGETVMATSRPDGGITTTAWPDHIDKDELTDAQKDVINIVAQPERSFESLQGVADELPWSRDCVRETLNKVWRKKAIEIRQTRSINNRFIDESDASESVLPDNQQTMEDRFNRVGSPDESVDSSESTDTNSDSDTDMDNTVMDPDDDADSDPRCAKCGKAISPYGELYASIEITHMARRFESVSEPTSYLHEQCLDELGLDLGSDE